MKKIILLFALAAFTSSSLFAVTHGSIIKKNAPLDVVVGHDWNPYFPPGAVVDFKAVTIGGKIWASVVGTGYELYENPWSSQVRIYYTIEASQPFEISQNNVLPKYISVNRPTNTTIVTAYPYYAVAKISVCQDDDNSFNGTEVWVYDENAPNSGLTGDTEKPVLTSVQIGSQNGTTIPVSCTATDNSGDYFYLITDVANNYYYASLTDNFTLTELDSETTYSFTVYAVDFSGNESVGVINSVEPKNQDKITLSQNENSIVINSSVEIGSIKLYSINGQEILSQVSSNQLVISDIAKGVYVLNVQDIQGKLNKFKVVLK